MGQRYRNPFKGRPHESYKRLTTRYDGDAPKSIGYSLNATWGALKRCWRGYRIARKDCDSDAMILYAKRIRKLQFELGIKIAEFPEIAIVGIDDGDVDLMCE